MNALLSVILFVTIGTLWSPPALFAESVTWEEQAERLQFVSGALLDHIPMGEMPMGLSNIMVKSNISKLPQTNPTVGAKSEKVPSSPIHAVPTLQADFARDGGVFISGVRLWGGMLPPGSEKMVGLSAKLTEKSFGAAMLARLKFGFFEPGFEIGAQRSIAKVSGAITAEDANDSFHVDTLIGYGALGARIPALNVWGNLMAIARNSRSEFAIPADGTYFQLNDNQGPVGFQASVGADLFMGVNVGIGQLYLPERLTMTRVLAGIKVGI
jgi:hypothetical protein